MATDLATYYLNVVPSAKGMGGKLISELEGAGGEAGSKAASKFGSMFKKVIGALAIGKIFKDAIDGGAALQQSIGGIETMFKESAEKMQQYAAQAYNTAGVSANEYMTQVTSFSARLLQGLGDDTDLAADIANRAMVDMADNANKFGTDLAAIQNAYQGFAKENYTMLDNLKLGYGGTKTEMQRLIQDAAAMVDIQEELGITVDESSMSFDNIINAISVMQAKLDVAGTTQKEALGTYSGSFAAMKAAWENVVGYVAIGSPEVGSAVQNLAESVGAYVGNASTLIENIVSKLPGALVTIIESAGPQLIDSGFSLFVRLAEGLIESIPNILGKIPVMINALTAGINKYWPQLIKVGVDLVVNLAKGLIQAIPSICNTLPQLTRALLGGLAAGLVGVFDIGAQLVKGLWNGIVSVKNWVLSKIKGFGNSILSSLKSFFGIHSPSTLFRDEIGKNLALGVGIGFEKYIPVDSMSNALNDVAMDALSDTDTTLAVKSSLQDVSVDYGTNGLANNNYGGVTINVYTRDGQNEKAIAEYISELLDASVIKERAVFANG